MFSLSFKDDGSMFKDSRNPRVLVGRENILSLGYPLGWVAVRFTYIEV